MKKFVAVSFFLLLVLSLFAASNVTKVYSANTDPNYNALDNASFSANYVIASTEKDVTFVYLAYKFQRLSGFSYKDNQRYVPVRIYFVDGTKGLYSLPANNTSLGTLNPNGALEFTKITAW